MGAVREVAVKVQAEREVATGVMLVVTEMAERF